VSGNLKLNADDMVDDVGGFEKYIEKMSKPGTWGDGVILAAAARLYTNGLSLSLLKTANASQRKSQIEKLIQLSQCTWATSKAITRPMCR